MNARDHIRMAVRAFDEGDGDVQAAGVYALLSIACTLADMADMDADTRTQPAIRPVDPDNRMDMKGYYDLYHPGDPDRIPT